MAEYTSTPRYALRRPVLGQPNWGTHIDFLIDQLDAGVFVGAPGKLATKVCYGITVVAFVNQHAVQAPKVTFPFAFASASSYAVVANCDPSYRNVLCGVEGRQATGFSPRLDTVDNANITTNIYVTWIAIGQ